MELGVGKGLGEELVLLLLEKEGLLVVFNVHWIGVIIKE